MRAHAHSRTHARTHARARAHARTHARTHARSRAHTSTAGHSDTCANARTRARTRTSERARVRAHTHAHTYAPTCVQAGARTPAPTRETILRAIRRHRTRSIMHDMHDEVCCLLRAAEDGLVLADLSARACAHDLITQVRGMILFVHDIIICVDDVMAGRRISAVSGCRPL